VKRIDLVAHMRDLIRRDASAMLILLLLSLPCSVVHAQTIPLKAYSAMQWRLVGPFRAGRSIAAAGVPGNPYVFYFGGVDGGMWKTVNAGITWKSISNGLTNPSIGAIAIAPSDPNIIFVGTGEADLRSDITYGGGVYKSTDAGSHWQFIGLGDTRHIGRVLIDPKNPDLVLVAAVGHAYGPNEERGVFRTTDGGKTWAKVLYKNPDVGAVDLGSDPQDPAIVYATLWQPRRTPWSQYPPNEGPGSGLYKSTDEGVTWTELTGNGLPPKPYGRIGVSVATGSHGNIVYALINAQKEGSGLYRSDDGGMNWRLTSKDENIIARMWYFAGITVDPQNPDVVYVPNRSLMRSTDGGKTFPVIKGSPGGDDYHFLWVDPNNDNSMIVASDQGTCISVDRGSTWSSWYNQPTGQFYHVAVDNQFPYRIYGAQQDMGTASITSRSDFGQISFRDWYPVGGEESGYIAPDPLNANIVYGGGPYGGMTRYDHTTGQSQAISPSVLATFGTPANMSKYRFTWTSPIVFDRRDPHILYFGAQKLLETRDGGLRWKEISPDLTGADKKMMEKKGPPTMEDASARGWGVIYTIAPSPLRSGMIWIGTDDGLIQLTEDGGQHWKNVTPNGLPAWSKISMIEASPFDAGEAYAAVDRHRLDDFAPYIYITKDYGKHWSRANNGIDSLAYVQVVRSDLTRKGLLYAGTETGVYVSFDDGDNWQSLQLNLPMASVRDLAVHDNDLVAATHGRAFWVLDDLAPLQQLSEKAVTSEAFLFRPERAIRIRRSENRDTPLPPEEPLGTNPPSGAIIDYELQLVPSSPVTLEIRDGAGNLVRRYSSSDPVEPTEGPQYFMNYWLPRPKPLTTHVGHNRFVWDLRYTPPPSRQHGYSMAAIVGQGSERQPQGPLVLPGKYQVRLAVSGKTYSQPIEVEMDPRVHASAAGLKGQLSLAIECWNAASDQFAMQQTVESLDRQLDPLLEKKGTESTLKNDLQAFKSKLAGLRKNLSGGFTGLDGTVMGADREPSQQVREAFKTLNTKLSEAKKQWGELKSRELAKLNESLKDAGLAQLELKETEPQHLK
jgi:photosystem II stability/assembly factor-like uncharacterized protein